MQSQHFTNTGIFLVSLVLQQRRLRNCVVRYIFDNHPILALLHLNYDSTSEVSISVLAVCSFLFGDLDILVNIDWKPVICSSESTNARFFKRQITDRLLSVSSRFWWLSQSALLRHQLIVAVFALFDHVQDLVHSPVFLQVAAQSDT